MWAREEQAAQVQDDFAVPAGPDSVPVALGGGRARPAILLAVSAGGMVGAATRYGISRAVPGGSGRFPWGTLWANLAGSFLLGLLLVLALERLPPSRYLRPFLATGLLGSLTTMSTFQVETARLVGDHHVAIAGTYACATLFVGLGLAFAGARTGRRLSTPSREHRS